MANVAKTKKTELDNKIMVYLDRATGGEENFVRVGVNGKMYQVPRGKNVMVPRAVFDVLRRSSTAKAVTERYINQNEYVEKTNGLG